MLVQEAVGYNRFGLRCVSAEEEKANRDFVLSRRIPMPGEPDLNPFHKPFATYDDGKKSLAEIVEDRHLDEMNRLKEEYQVFFKWPENRHVWEYQQRKKDLEDDYKMQQSFVVTYKSTEDRIRQAKARMSENNLRLGCALMLGSGLLISRHFAWALVVYALAVAGIGAITVNETRLIRRLKKSNEHTKKTLVKWHDQDYWSKSRDDA